MTENGPRRRPMRADRRPAPRCGPGARARGRAPAGTGDVDLGGDRGRARPGRRRGVPPGRDLGIAELLVEADAPIVAQELRLRSGELLAAFAAARGASGASSGCASPRMPPRIIRQTCQPLGADPVHADPASGSSRRLTSPHIERGPHGRPSPTEARVRRRAGPARRFARHAGRRRAERRLGRPLEGQPLPPRHVTDELPSRAARRRDSPPRRSATSTTTTSRLASAVCLQKAIATANKRLLHQRRSAGPQGARGERADRRRRRPSSAATRCTWRPSGRRRPTSSARHACRRCPTRIASADCRRTSSSPRSGAARSRSATRSCSTSPNIVARLGPDELKDAMVTLHPQSAMEHLHHRFMAADGPGSDGAIAFEATEVAPTTRGASSSRSGRPNRWRARRTARRSRSPTTCRPPAPRSPLRRTGPNGGRRRLRTDDRAAPGPAAAAQARVPSGHAPRLTTRDAAPGGDRRARPPRRRRRPRDVGLGVRWPYAAGRHQLDQRRPGRARQGARGPRQVSGPGIDLVADDRDEALRLLTEAYAELGKAEDASVGSRGGGPGPRQGRGAARPRVRRRRRDLDAAVHVQGGTGSGAVRHAVDGPRRRRRAVRDGLARPSPSIGWTSSARSATKIAKNGRTVGGTRMARPEAARGGWPGPAHPRHQERAVALAAVE